LHTLPAAEFANLHFVTPTLAIGGDISAYDDELAALQFAEICSLGITHIVDTRLEWSDLDAFAASAPHIGYLHHGMDDAGQAVGGDWHRQDQVAMLARPRQKRLQRRGVEPRTLPLPSARTCSTRTSFRSSWRNSRRLTAWWWSVSGGAISRSPSTTS
jgi:hypothetical protein